MQLAFIFILPMVQPKRLIFDKQNCELKDNVYLDIWRQILPDCIEDFEIETVNKK